jgi:hypothetical protein
MPSEQIGSHPPKFVVGDRVRRSGVVLIVKGVISFGTVVLYECVSERESNAAPRICPERFLEKAGVKSVEETGQDPPATVSGSG